MKKLAMALVVMLIALTTTIQAQKTYKASDVIGGKTISTLAKEWDLQAFQDTKEIYKPGMSQETFISIIKEGFPSAAKESFKDVFLPYYKYIYNFHAKGLTDSKVSSSITGNETAALVTSLSAWDVNNPGQLSEILKFHWKGILQFLFTIFLPTIILL